MKRSGKILAFVLALCLLLAAPLNVSAEGKPLGDVPPPESGAPAWYSGAVYLLYQSGIIRGTDKTVPENGYRAFEPNRPVTREEFLTFLGRLAENQGKNLRMDPNGQWVFFDLLDGSISPFASSYMEWAVLNSIVKGNGKGGLAAKQTMTRQEMAAILLRFAGYMGISTSGMEDGRDFEAVADRGRISPWAEEEMQAAYLTGLLNGRIEHVWSYDEATGLHADGWLTYLDPQKAVTRAEAAQAIYNYVQKAGLELSFPNDME